MSAKLRNSLLTYGVLVLVMAGAKAILLTGDIQAAVPVQAASASLPFAVAVVLGGLIGVLLSTRAGFPEMCNEKASLLRRLLLSGGIGVVFAAVLIGLNSLFPLGQINVPFPHSIPFYLQGGIEATILHQLIPLPLLVWLFSGVLFGRRWQTQTFWVVTLLTALVEPGLMLSVLAQNGILAQSGLPLLMLLVSYGADVTGGYLFRKWGFLAPLTMRIVLYLFWHVLWGLLTGM